MAQGASIQQVRSGDHYDVVRGSRAGVLGVTGTLEVEELTDTAATLRVSVGKFGFRVDVTLRMERDGDQVDIIASGRAFDEIRTRGAIVVNEPRELRIRDVSGELADTHVVIAADGSAVVESEIPTVGRVRLLLEPA